MYFNSQIASQLWKDEGAPLDLGEASRRFPQWTFLPILPNCDETLRVCIREGIKDKLWAVAIGDAASLKFQRLIELPDELDGGPPLFDGSASLVKGDLLDLMRDALRRPDGANIAVGTDEDKTTPEAGGVAPGPGPLTLPVNIPAPTRRFSRVVLKIEGLGIAKTSNLQPYLFKVLQEQDAGAALRLSIDVTSSIGISEDVLRERIVQAFDQLGIEIDWQPG